MKRQLRDEVNAAGISWPKIQKKFPDWADEAFSSMSGLLELKAFVARHTGLQINRDGTLSAKELPAVCFKTNIATSADEVVSARSFATACARLIAKSTVGDYQKLSDDPSELRAEILGSDGVDCVDFRSLVNACWARGIPVLHLPDMPVHGKKMDGMVTFVGGRPVIVLAKSAKHHPDWLLFTLAHEIGHIAKGHLPEEEGEALVDEKVELDAGANDDEQEKQANDFATELLAPGGTQVRLTGRMPNAHQLAFRATKYAREHTVSDGYVILNAVNNTLIKGKKPFALGQAALKFLPSARGPSAINTCKEALGRKLNLEILRDDSVDFLRSLELL